MHRGCSRFSVYAGQVGRMSKTLRTLPRSRLVFGFLVIVAIGHLLKSVLDPVIWRYSGPVSLGIMLVALFFYLRWRRCSWSWIGLVPLNSKKQLVRLPAQVLLAFIAIPATGLALGLCGEALGIEFMRPDAAGAENRFGDLAGNTALYLTWLSILWFAGPAEELYFRGFMIGQLQDIFGPSRLATALTIVIPALIFGAGHMYYLGLRGFVMTGGIGVTLGCLYVLYNRNIWPLMIAHAAFNSLTFTALYREWDI